MLRLTATLLFILALPLAAWADEAPELNALAGKWTYAQTVSADVYVDEVVLTVGDKGVGGVMKYNDGEVAKQDVFSNFAVDKWGRLTFITTRPNGRVVKHTGEFSNNGSTIRGSYNLGFGVGGRFVLDRVMDTVPPSMSGRWEYRIINPAGGDDTVGDALLLGDSSGFFEGYLTYRNIETSHKKIEGTVADDGSLRFELYEKGTYVHEGTLEENGSSSKGVWSNSKIGDGLYSLKKFTE